MARYRLYPVIGTLLLTVFSSISGAIDLECGIYEQEVECVDICNICDENRPCPKTYCVPGCDCIPGFSRNNLGNCIPWQNCDEDNFGVFKKPVPASGVDKRGNVLGFSDGCPVTEFCVVSCRKRGFGDGVCMEPDNLYCNCFSRLFFEKIEADDEPAKDPNDHGCPKKPEKCRKYCEENKFKAYTCVKDIVTDPTKVKYICRCLNCTPGVDGCPKGDEVISPQMVGGEPAIAPNDHGCPNNLVECVNYCVSISQRKKNGMCVGNQCQCCTPGVGRCSAIDASGVDKRGNVLGFSDGCPVPEFCIASCKQRGFENGVCMGPDNLYCNCFSGLLVEQILRRIEADDALAKDPNEEDCRKNPKTCADVCRFLSNGKQNGICDGKKCRCCTPGVGRCPKITGEISAQIISDDDSELSQLLEDNGCPKEPSRCDRHCRAQGYLFGICDGEEKKYCLCV